MKYMFLLNWKAFPFTKNISTYVEVICTIGKIDFTSKFFFSNQVIKYEIEWNLSKWTYSESDNDWIVCKLLQIKVRSGKNKSTTTTGQAKEFDHSPSL